MGNSQTHSKKQSKKNIQVSNPAFQTAQLVKSTNGKDLIEIMIPMKSEKDYIEWTKNYKRIPKVNSVLYPENTKYENKGCCGSSGIAHAQYQKFPYILAEEISIRRSNNQQHFGENELWLLLFSLVDSAQMFHVRKLKVGDIRPENVFMSSEGQVKIASQFSYPYGTTNYEKNLTNREIVTYLAPQEIKDIQFGKMKDSNDPLTVQTFSIGLTVLDAALLSSSENFYGINSVFNYEKLNESLRLLAHINCSPQLTYIITKMCDLQPNNRLKANQVLKLLRPYEKEILSQKPFNVKSLPSGTPQQPNKQVIINPTNPSANSGGNNNRIPINNNIQKQDDYIFVPGVVFDSKDDGLMQSSLKHGKEVTVRMSKIPNTYNIQKEEMKDLQSPVQTTIFYPPITIQLPPPIEQDFGSQINHR